MAAIVPHSGPASTSTGPESVPLDERCGMLRHCSLRGCPAAVYAIGIYNGVSKLHLGVEVPTHTMIAPNVRLQARAARGASHCKPLFGGTRTLTALSQKAAHGHFQSLADPLFDHAIGYPPESRRALCAARHRERRGDLEELTAHHHRRRNAEHLIEGSREVRRIGEVRCLRGGR